MPKKRQRYDTFDLQCRWMHDGGSFYRFVQEDHQDVGGVCLSMCKAWAVEALEDTSGKARMKAICKGGTWDAIMRDNEAIQNESELVIPAKPTHTVLRTWATLRSRKDVLDRVLKVPGVYVFSAWKKGNGGHAVAFDTRGNSLYFMDPNAGQFWVDSRTTISEDRFRSWFTAWWESQDFDYKKDFHKGWRRLARYSGGV